MDAKFDNYCGLYCDACPIQLYSETGCIDDFTACLRSIPKEALKCGGCKSDTTYYGCQACPIRKCAREKAISHCTNCDRYPCRLYKRWRSGSRILPHIGEVASNFANIQKMGIEAWFSLQKARWTCPDCGKLFSWYASVCASCGRHLEGKAFNIRGFRRILCRLILPLAYKKVARQLHAVKQRQ
jgi:hypothetical protein